MQEIRRDVKFIGAALAVTFLVIGILAGPGGLVMGIVASATLFACGVLRWADIRSDIHEPPPPIRRLEGVSALIAYAIKAPAVPAG